MYGRKFAKPEWQVDAQELFADKPHLLGELRSMLNKRQTDTDFGTQPAGAQKRSPVSQSPTQPTPTLTQGQVVGDCRIIRELGRGGMGVVYLGQHVRLDVLRAIKILPRERVNDDAISRFWREAQLAASIEHLNVVPIHDVGNEGDLHYIIMQYVDGETLSQRFQRLAAQADGRPFPWHTVLRFVRPVLDALAVMHSKNLVHRDIKPSNIMVVEKQSSKRKDHVLLMDFGLVLDKLDARITNPGTPVGTPAYMAPEQARSDAVDGRADIYAVGATIYSLLTGRAPFEGHYFEVLHKLSTNQHPVPLGELRPDLPPGVCAVVERAMAPIVSQRYGRAEEMLKEVNALLQRSRKPSGGQEAALPEPTVKREATPTDVEHDTPAASADSTKDLLPLFELPPVTHAQAGTANSSSVTSTWARWLATQLKLASRGARWKSIAFIVTVCSLVLCMYVLTPAISNWLTPKKSADRQGMIHIPPGVARIGASEACLQRYSEALATIIQRPDLIQNFVQQCQRETEKAVQLPGFWIDKYEVTNQQYAQFLRIANYPPPSHWKGNVPPVGREDHPVTDIRYSDAVAYAAWAGKKLPTIAQWERAFRGPDDRIYPWGNDWHPERANVQENKDFSLGTSSIMASPMDVTDFGVFNMLGNVSEMVRDRTSVNGVSATIIKGADSECLGCVQGAAPFQSFLVGDDQTYKLTGFRCVVEAE